jgi:protein-tyrosine phosphatase
LDEVPDPYYGGDEGFENVITLIRDATQALISSMELR